MLIAKKDLKPSDVYSALGIHRVSFYQAIKSPKINNKSLLRILDYLDAKIMVSLVEKGDKE